MDGSEVEIIRKMLNLPKPIKNYKMATAKKVAPKVREKFENPLTDLNEVEQLRMTAMENEKPYRGKDPLKHGYCLRNSLNGEYDWFPDYDNAPELHPL
jgi:hypothetical protein